MFSFSDENVQKDEQTREKKNFENSFFRGTEEEAQFEEVLHDLMSSINIILLGENIISKKISKETAEDIGKYLRSIRFNSYKIINLANGLKKVCNAYEIEDSDDFITFNMVEVIENLIISFTPFIEKKNINFKFINSENRIDIYSDLKSVDRIISNLVYNAIKYTHENGNVAIKLKTLENKQIEIEIIDDGIGIPKQNISNIFLRNEKVNKDSEGQGIGLYIAKQKAKMLGGDISLQSYLGQGSKFTVILPLIKSV
ncbi:MAG: HAMP domain-containing histidine kinase [Oscillospiraceae bacterium]|nr:HAMP domain-containing histidine kinase [Oscillospiraceae bacterium]